MKNNVLNIFVHLENGAKGVSALGCHVFDSVFSATLSSIVYFNNDLMNGHYPKLVV